jgi:hypothetical protein
MWGNASYEEYECHNEKANVFNCEIFTGLQVKLIYSIYFRSLKFILVVQYI